MNLRKKKETKQNTLFEVAENDFKDKSTSEQTMGSNGHKIEKSIDYSSDFKTLKNSETSENSEYYQKEKASSPKKSDFISSPLPNILMYSKEAKEFNTNKTDSDRNLSGNLPLKTRSTMKHLKHFKGNNLPSEETLFRSKSENRTVGKEQKSRNVIKKDVDRTFQGDKYFKVKENKIFLENVLYNYTLKSYFGYVQGMNFIAASIMHHSLNYQLVFNIFMFIQGKICPNIFNSFIYSIKVGNQSK